MTNNVVGFAVALGISRVVVGGVIVGGGGGGTLATAVDLSMGAAVAPDKDNAVSAVVPLSSTNDKAAYVGASVAFEGVCVGALTDSAPWTTPITPPIH